jgi:type III pantothenate kinase
MTSEVNIVAISTGNSRTQVGVFQDDRLQEREVFDNRQLAAVVEAVVRGWESISARDNACIVSGSVNRAVSQQIVSMVEDQLSIEVYHIGEDIPPPIGIDLDPETITGVDRLLNAAAAFDTIRQACVIVDAGTAVTVDFVDGEGTFCGGAIAPGAGVQMRSLHERTAALPDLEFRAPANGTFGKSTGQAMLQGVFYGIQGLVWKLIERYAEGYQAYPMVIATGGDAPTIFGNDPLVDRIVPELTLLGIAVAMRHALKAKLDDDE